LFFSYARMAVNITYKMLSYRRETALYRRVIIFAKKVEDWNWETIFDGHYRSIFNHCDIISLKAVEFGEINAK